MTERTPVGLQLYSVHEECKKDITATIKAVAALGYDAAEIYGFSGETLAWMGLDAMDLRKVFDNSGIACCGMHIGTGAIMGDNLKRTIEMNQILGSQFAIIAGDGKRMASPEGVMELAGILNDAAARLAPLGLYTGYHAHGNDFASLGELTAWDMLFGNTVDDVVMQMDVGNCMHGGGDPVAIMEKFPGRTKSIHLKDHGGETAIVGQGKADWAAVFAVCDKLHQPKWYVVEEETNGGVGFGNAGLSLAALQGMGRA